MKIIHADRETLYPRFGLCAADGTWIAVRSDLPPIVQNFVLHHELYHAGDPERRLWLRELKANWHAFKKSPRGFLATAAMSLSPYRLGYYWRRIREGR